MIRLIGILAGILGTFGCSMAKYEPGKLPAISESESAMALAIEKDLKFLTVEIGERNAWKYEKLNKSADWIEGQFKEMGYVVSRQEFEVQGAWDNADGNAEKRFYNIVAELKGETDGVIVMGAHYDTVRGVPGADDNGTGVAVMLETARGMAGEKCKKNVRFVAFVNEEWPFFGTDAMGSRVYAKECKKRGDKIEAMVCVDTVGYYRDEKGTQRYPIAAGKWVYGSRGNYMFFIGNLRSWDLTERASRIFWDKGTINCERLVYPDTIIKGQGSSDMASFWEAGYPAVVVTDTANLRNRACHTPGDTMENLDMEKLGRVGQGMLGVIRELAGSDKR